MASYRLLSPHYVRTRYLEAGEVVSDGPGGFCRAVGFRRTDVIRLMRMQSNGSGTPEA